ncbi:MAG: sugar phosphate isomerase/epimerase family protein [Chloroflexota bacterium]
MRLGLTTMSYQWLFANPAPVRSTLPPVDGLDFDWLGMPAPYSWSTPTHVPPGEALEWIIRRARELGLALVNAPVVRWQEGGYIDRIGDLLAASGIEIIPSFGADYVSQGDDARRAAEQTVAHLQVAKRLGAEFISIRCSPRKCHRFSSDPPVAAQLQMITETLALIAPAAEAEGITLTLENHVDYRGYEIVQIVDAVNSPSVKALLDTANAVTVCEDAVDAARMMAPHTAVVHLKDLRIMPSTYRGLQMWGAPLGRGNIDNVAIMGILNESAPDPIGLPVIIEINWLPPNEDADKLVVSSVEYARATFAAMLNRNVGVQDASMSAYLDPDQQLTHTN